MLAIILPLMWCGIRWCGEPDVDGGGFFLLEGDDQLTVTWP